MAQSPQNGRMSLHVTEQTQYDSPINGIWSDILAGVKPANNARVQPLSFSDTAHAAPQWSTLLIPILASF